MKASHPTKLPIATAPALTVRVAQTHEALAVDGQLADHHYLRQLVERDGRPVALLVWGHICYALKDRDLWISWSASQRVERLKLVVQNCRFLLLAAKGQSPNLASQCLGASLRALPGAMARTGAPPLALRLRIARLRAGNSLRAHHGRHARDTIVVAGD